MTKRMCNSHQLRPLNTALLVLGLLQQSDARNVTYSPGTDPAGVERQLASDRAPLLYSENFGDCLHGGSLLNITRYDVALYRDNSTLAFHLDGSTDIESAAITLFISVEAYGESYFQMTVDPCFNNITSLCPIKAGTPIAAYAPLQVTAKQFSDIPQIAFDMPDFDGYSKLQLIVNTSQAEIGCFQAAMSNGASFSQPAVVGSVLGVFTVAAVLASFITSAYGESIPHMRAHYAHSISVLVIFEAFHSILYSGALSLRWPRLLTAWWSNFAWSSGLIMAPGIMESINRFTGVEGNMTQAGGVGNTTTNHSSQSVLRQDCLHSLPRGLAGASTGLWEKAAILVRRQSSDADNPYEYTWSGSPVNPAMPFPGDWSGFRGTLVTLQIPVIDAFLVALIWLLIFLAAAPLVIVLLKFVLEAITGAGWVKRDLLPTFRSHWKAYVCLFLMRTLLVASFPMTTLAILQLTQTGPAGPLAIGGVVLAGVVLALGGVSIYALRSRYRAGRFISERDYIIFRRGTIFGCIPFPVPARLSQVRNRIISTRSAGSLPFVRLRFVSDYPGRSRVDQDWGFLKRFGWLTTRYRATKWWYFAFWLGCQLVRACFIAGATASPLAQIFGVFLVDVISLVATVALDPYEGRRNTVLAVWLLGLAKITATGLSIAFLPDIGTERVLATVVGLIIIVIQTMLIVAIMVLIILGVVSSWMSLTRNREYFSPRILEGTRISYFKHVTLDVVGKKRAPPRAEPKVIRGSSEAEDSSPADGGQRHFSVNHVRRVSKIEDEAVSEEDSIAEMEPFDDPGGPSASPSAATRRVRASSISSRHSVSNLPRAARVHRASWSSRDITPWQSDAVMMERPSPALVRALSKSQLRPPRGSEESTANATPENGRQMSRNQTHPPIQDIRASGKSLPEYQPRALVRESLDHDVNQETVSVQTRST